MASATSAACGLALRVRATLGPVVSPGVQAAASVAGIPTLEIYLGHARGERFQSPSGLAKCLAALYASPPVLRPDGWGLRGRWTVEDGHARSEDEAAVIVLRFRARDVQLVMGPTPPGSDHGIDVDAQGVGQARAHRLYQLVRHTALAREQTLEIRFGDAGIQVYALTFG